MNKQEKLLTKRLCLHPFDEKFLSARYVAWLNDADVVRYSEQRHCVHTLDSCRSFVASCDGQSHMLWAIEEMEKGLGHVGNIDTVIDVEKNEADIRILIGEKSVWGTGIGLEAWLAVMTFLFDRLGLNKVTAGTTVSNQAMRSLMAKSNMREEEGGREHIPLFGPPVDVVYSSILKDDWLQRK